MLSRWLLTTVLVLGFSSNLWASDYPISGVWANANGSLQGDPAKACASYFRNPKVPEGNLIVFKGSKKTEYNGGYLEEETVNNLAVRRIGENEFQVTESYYDDGDGGGRPGWKRRSYKLRQLTPDKIEIKEGNYPSNQFIRCSSNSLGAESRNPPDSRVQLSTTTPPAGTNAFYKKRIDENWSVTGVTYQSNKPAACFGENVYKDGSTFQLSVDPSAGVLYIWFKDNSWEIKGPFNKQYRLRLNIFNDKEIIEGGEFKFNLLNKNTISIIDIASKTFFAAFERSNKLVFVMPGTITNSTVTIQNTKAVLGALDECIRQFKFPTIALTATQNAREPKDSLVEPSQPLEKPPSIELSKLITLFLLPSSRDEVAIPWTTASDHSTPIEWQHAGIKGCEPAIENLYQYMFCRTGKVTLTSKGKPSHLVLGNIVRPGRWTIRMIGPHAGAMVVAVESDENSGDLDANFLSRSIDRNSSIGLKLDKRCGGESTGTERFEFSGKTTQTVYGRQDWSCGSGGCSVQLLFAIKAADLKPGEMFSCPPASAQKPEPPKDSTPPSKTETQDRTNESQNRPDLPGRSYFGKWYTNDPAACAGDLPEGGGLVEYSAEGVQNYETFCRVTNSVSRGRKTDLTMRCSTEGETHTVLDHETVEVIIGGKLKRALREGRKQRTFTYNRCPSETVR